MPLEFTVESIDNLEEDLQTLYVKGEDEKFHLRETLKAEIGGLKSALEKERTSRATLEKERRKLQADLERFKDVDPERYRESLQKLDELEAQALGDKGKFDPNSEEVQKYFEKKTERLRSDLGAQMEGLKGKLSETEKERDTLKENLHRMVMTTVVDRAALEAGVRKDALELVRLTASTVFRVEGEGELIPRDPENQIIYGNDASRPMSPEEWVQSVLRRKYPYIFEGSGGGAANNKGSGAVSNKRPAEMSPAEKSRFIAENGFEAWEKLVNESLRK